MPRFSSTDSFKTRTSSQVRQKGSTFHSVKEIKQGVGDKLEFMYRIESDGIVDKKIYNRQKLKTYFFFTIDLAVIIVCTYALFKKFTDWKECYYKFDAWAVCIVILSGLSLILNFGTAFNLSNKQKNL